MTDKDWIDAGAQITGTAEKPTSEYWWLGISNPLTHSGQTGPKIVPEVD